MSICSLISYFDRFYRHSQESFVLISISLGTVFAVTGGLAAPALAAGIGGLASLTGAGTASSTAILAVLATFKAGKLVTLDSILDT